MDRRSSLRYGEAVELAEVLEYEIVWQKRRERRCHYNSLRIIPCFEPKLGGQDCNDKRYSQVALAEE